MDSFLVNFVFISTFNETNTNTLVHSIINFEIHTTKET